MKFTSRWQYHLLWSSIFCTSLSGALLLVMKYFSSPINKFSVINHPWQGIVLKIHLLFAPIMTFAIGYTTVLHAFPYMKEKIRKSLKTGFFSLLLISPMIASGYLIQSFTDETWVSTSAITHIITSFLFLITFILHQFISYRDRFIVHTVVIFSFVLLSASPLWALSQKKISKEHKLNPNTVNSKKNVVERSWLLMGTILFVEIEATNQKIAEKKAEIVWRVIHKLEEKMTTYNSRSEISQVNHLAHFQYTSIDKNLFEIISLSKKIAKQSFFAFDITVAPLINLWKDFTAKNELPPQKYIQDILKHVGSSYIKMNDRDTSIFFTNQKLAINLGGIGKGFALEKAMEQIIDDSLFCATFNFGGQIVYLKNKSFCENRHFIVKQPNDQIDKDEVIEFKIDSTFSLATSSNDEEFFTHEGVRYGHILDPRTGQPANKVLSVTVGHPSPSLSDAWSTALFILGHSHEKRILKLYPRMKIRWALR